jgi:hypothetical protein
MQRNELLGKRRTDILENLLWLDSQKIRCINRYTASRECQRWDVPLLQERLQFIEERSFVVAGMTPAR